MINRRKLVVDDANSVAIEVAISASKDAVYAEYLRGISLTTPDEPGR
jgi:hypothetical protein